MAKLTGSVTLAGTAPTSIKDAEVKIFEGTTLVVNAVTNEDGQYEIRQLERGKTYTVKVIVNGEEVHSDEITINAQTNTRNVSIETGTTSPGTGGTSSGAAASTGNFNNLTGLIKQPAFSKDKAVEISEAREFRRLFRVGNLILAQVPRAIENLNRLLTSSPTDITLTVNNKEALLDKHGDKINSILQRQAEDFNDEEAILEEVRRQFDLGTSTVDEVNIEFKTIYREYLDLCNDDLLSINPEQVKNKSSFGPDKEEELYELLRKLQRSIIKVTSNMSVAGTLGTRSLTQKWSAILFDALEVINDVALNFVPYDDTDKKHVWFVVAALNGKQKREIDPYVVQANEGASMLYYAIEIYDKIKDDLKKEDRTHLLNLFHKDEFAKEGDPENKFTASKLLRENATLVIEDWIPDWA
ncbi:MAG: carboxypeptidase-like regulatory domain-containing protein [Candidatus Aminicenantes bacterium]|jgi:hypothetical protein